jgi:hypothetical protein
VRDFWRIGRSTSEHDERRVTIGDARAEMERRRRDPGVRLEAAAGIARYAEGDRERHARAAPDPLSRQRAGEAGARRPEMAACGVDRPECAGEIARRDGLPPP